MSLSCDCEIDGFDSDSWWYETFDDMDFIPLQTKRRRRCCSCKTLISIGADCLQFHRFRYPVSSIEESIWGDEVQLADWYLCAECGEIYLNLYDLGYCYLLGDDLRENLKDYWEITGFKPDEEAYARRT